MASSNKEDVAIKVEEVCDELVAESEQISEG